MSDSEILRTAPGHGAIYRHKTTSTRLCFAPGAGLDDQGTARFILRVGYWESTELLGHLRNVAHHQDWTLERPEIKIPDGAPEGGLIGTTVTGGMFLRWAPGASRRDKSTHAWFTERDGWKSYRSANGLTDWLEADITIDRYNTKETEMAQSPTQQQILDQAPRGGEVYRNSNTYLRYAPGASGTDKATHFYQGYDDNPAWATKDGLRNYESTAPGNNTYWVKIREDVPVELVQVTDFAQLREGQKLLITTAPIEFTVRQADFEGDFSIPRVGYVGATARNSNLENFTGTVEILEDAGPLAATPGTLFTDPEHTGAIWARTDAVGASGRANFIQLAGERYQDGELIANLQGDLPIIARLVEKG